MLFKAYPFVWIFLLYIIIIFIDDPFIVNILGESYKNYVLNINLENIIFRCEISQNYFFEINLSTSIIILSVIVLFIKIVQVTNFAIFNLKLHKSILNMIITTIFLAIFIAFDWAKTSTFIILILLSYTQSIGEFLIINFINRIYSFIMLLIKKDAGKWKDINKLKIKDFKF